MFICKEGSCSLSAVFYLILVTKSTVFLRLEQSGIFSVLVFYRQIMMLMLYSLPFLNPQLHVRESVPMLCLLFDPTLSVKCMLHRYSIY